MEKKDKLTDIKNDLKLVILENKFKRYNNNKLEKTRNNIKMLKQCNPNSYQANNVSVDSVDIDKIKNKEIKKFIKKMNEIGYNLDRFINKLFSDNSLSIVESIKNYYSIQKNSIFIKKKDYSEYIYHYLFHVSTGGFQFNDSFVSFNEGMTEYLNQKYFSKKVDILMKLIQ